MSFSKHDLTDNTLCMAAPTKGLRRPQEIIMKKLHQQLSQSQMDCREHLGKLDKKDKIIVELEEQIELLKVINNLFS